MVRNYSHETDKSLNLCNFLDHYDLKPYELYKSSSLSELMSIEGLVEDFIAPDIALLKNAFKRMASLDSLYLIDFLLDYLSRDEFSVECLSPEEKLILLMFHYTVWVNSPDGDIIGYLYRLKYDNSPLFEELLELLKYNKRSIDFVEHRVDLGFPCPLSLHSTKTTP